MVTCRLGSVKMAKALLDHNADIDFTNKAGHTWYVCGGCINCVFFVLIMWEEHVLLSC